MAMSFSPMIPIEKMQFPSFSAPEKTGGAGDKTSFQDMLSGYMQEVKSLTQIAEQDGARLALGNAEDLAQIQINAMKAEAALQTTVQLASRAVNAYKEIMQMQV